jgi:hypothetical protein
VRGDIAESAQRHVDADPARRPLVNKAVSIDQALAEIRGKEPMSEAPETAS